MELMQIFWLVALIVFAIVEALTMGLASIWFCAGALVALIAGACGAPLWLQLLLFFVVSAACMALVRPIAKRRFAPRRVRTNADRVLDTVAVVTETIDNIAATGAVQAGGIIWTARSESGAVLHSGSRVRVLRIEGVKLFVAPLPEEPSEKEESYHA